MSFRWQNLSYRDPSDRSFMVQGNQLYATSIGVTKNGTTLSCVMDMDAKECRFFKSESMMFEILGKISHKQLRESFTKIQKYTHYHREKVNTVFLPEALNNGNYNAMASFLDRLKSNKVGGYLNLNIQQTKGSFTKATTLIKPATKLVRQRLRSGFVRMKQHMMQEIQKDKKRLILQQLELISSIDHKDSQNSEKGHRLQNNLLKVSYRKVRANPQKLIEMSTRLEEKQGSRGQSLGSRKVRNIVDIDDLLSECQTRQYHFQNVDISRIYSARAKVQEHI